MFNRMIQITGLDITLHGADPFTVFAPRDRAFTQLPKAVMQLTSNVLLLTEMVNSHIVAGDLRYQDLVSMNSQSY
ncbi:fasciclin domain-containing protein [Chamaesiphon sp.]|uniref:fasciclin domain-containing protein n=1 Tax=Chamaesiphon sp. TaxID=2814140 RepID=UPI0035940AE9